MSKAEVTLPAAVSSVPTARHFVESILSGWGLSGLGWTATLIVSELAANAALHARDGDFSIRILLHDGGVRIEVTDASVRLPRQRSYSNDATTGRGLRLVADLAQEWGVTPSAEGKTVWVQLAAPDDVTDIVDDLDVDALLAAYDDDDVPVSEGSNQPTVRSGWLLAVAA
jgi:anti-sigma regulatory factor (Ser/Thr protein kinase)